MASSPYIYCPKCQSQNKRGEQVCFACGRPLPGAARPQATTVSQAKRQADENLSLGQRFLHRLHDALMAAMRWNFSGRTHMVRTKVYTDEELRNERWEQYKRKHLRDNG